MIYIKRLLGHSWIETTMKYMHADEEHERAAVDSLCDVESDTKVVPDEISTGDDHCSATDKVLKMEESNGGPDDTNLEESWTCAGDIAGSLSKTLCDPRSEAQRRGTLLDHLEH
ncbi:MAG: hypothetical protein KAJ37_09700, partial [Candidatus Krumholzibacteria bacterium]|nr:hypothetical protein [Candidatus Krumholzibacteria bacterium]